MRTFDYLLLCTVLVLCGCTISRTSHIMVSGTNMATPYGNGNINSEYDATTSYWFLSGTAKEINTTNVEIINANP